MPGNNQDQRNRNDVRPVPANQDAPRVTGAATVRTRSVFIDMPMDVDVARPDVNIWHDETLVAMTQRMRETKPKQAGNVAAMYGINPPDSVKKALASHPGMQLFGIELEIEKFPVGLDTAASVGFQFKPDGSLRNNGIEAISNPNNSIGTLAVTKTLWEKYKISSENFSDRTSIHVHCNVLDFTVDQLKNLAMLYCLFEEILFDLVDESRRDNIFCVPWAEAGLHVGNFKRVWESPANWQKYTALNLRTVRELGTVEFRHMHGHSDFVLLSPWIRVLEELMSFCKTVDYEKVYNRVTELNTSSEYAQFLQDVFPTECEYLKATSNNWQKHMVDGVIQAKFNSV